MTVKHQAGLSLLVLALLGAALYGWWVHDASRRASLTSLARLDAALHAGRRAELLDLLVVPAALQGRSAAEQSEFLAKALNDEISPEGLAVLRKHGAYGPLRKLFPNEAESWAKEAGVNPDACVAFKLERPGVRAEVVLVPDASLGTRPSSPGFRVVRLNNVKQLAEATSDSTSEKKP